MLRATALAEEASFIWLDSAVPGSGSVSILTSAPTQILKGQIDHDWSQVEALLN